MIDDINNIDQKIKIIRRLSKISVKKHYQLKRQLNKPIHFTEYFLVIGVNPNISINKYLYNSSPIELETTYKNEIYPEIITKFPPMNKSYVNIGSNLIDLCFPNGFHLEQYYNPPQSEIFHLLLDNSFYSAKYTFKYITCLKFYEDLTQYYKLYSILKKELGNKMNNVLLKHTRSKSNEGDLSFDNSNDINAIGRASIASSKLLSSDLLNKNQLNVISKYYFPKIICLVSIHPFFKEQEEILKQIYNYYIDNKKNDKKNNIPFENIILNILCNIPLPPNGIASFNYKINEKYNNIIIKNHKMNQLKNKEEYLNCIFKIFEPSVFIEIFKYIIFETKTLIFSDNLEKLCYFIYGLISTLFPFEFPFQVSSSVPESAFELLESISPYILGINTKYYENFFIKNKIDIIDCNLIIIDLDKKEYIAKTVEDLPNIPKNISKRLRDKITNEMHEKKNAHKNLGDIFLDFFVNILYDYSNFLNNEYLKINYKITSLNVLFNKKNFVDSHSSSDRPFYNKLVQTQMFSDFIFKKMIPKDINDKLLILFFDENIIKKNNKKLFAKQKNTIFLNSTEYEYRGGTDIPMIKELTESEKFKFQEKNYRINNLFNGQEIKISNDDTISINYILFPKFNKQFFNDPSVKIIDYPPTNINRINTELLAKTTGGNKSIIEENGFKDFVYLTYVAAWANSFWYLDRIEVEYRFEQLLEILEKINHFELEIIDSLFEALNKFDETEKILKLYNFLLAHKITPDSFVFSIVSKIKNKPNSKNVINNSNSNINNNIQKKRDSLDLTYNENISLFKKRTFHSDEDDLIIGDTVEFDCIQICEKCEAIIDLELLSMDYKNMKKEVLWAKCPECTEYIRPKITVHFGNNFSNENSFQKCSNSETFSICSPYELKNYFTEIICKGKCGMFDVNKFKKSYILFFWNVIWYFKINNIDYDIILPYESIAFKSKTTKNIILQKISCKIFDNTNRNELNNYKSLSIKNSIKLSNKKKNTYTFLIIQNIYSFLYINNLFYENYKIYEISKKKSSNKVPKKKIKTFIRRKTCAAPIRTIVSISNFLNSASAKKPSKKSPDFRKPNSDNINENNTIKEESDIQLKKGDTFKIFQEINEIKPTALLRASMVSMNLESLEKKDIERSRSMLTFSNEEDKGLNEK